MPATNAHVKAIKTPSVELRFVVGLIVMFPLCADGPSYQGNVALQMLDQEALCVTNVSFEFF